jgi:hypothetical protein
MSETPSIPTADETCGICQSAGAALCSDCLRQRESLAPWRGLVKYHERFNAQWARVLLPEVKR